MANIIFYEKPGCINGGKQKNILQQAGHALECRNILHEPWTAASLLPFVNGKSPADMMNWTAPAIKKGEIKPAELSFEDALELMCEDPILIKRPLIIVEGCFIQGFRDTRLNPYLGDWRGEEDVTTCPRLQTLSCDERQESAYPKK
jgi:arsenate reductase